MITTRNSNDHLHTETILEKISEYDIFKYYCPNFTKFNLKFCSDLRKDSFPSVSIITWNSKLLYKDFGHPDHTFNCFGYVQKKFNINFSKALVQISNDFGLGLASMNGHSLTYSKPVLYNKTIEDKKVTIIKKKRRPWYTKDAIFWMKYKITKEILTIFAVEPLEYYWINENRFKCNTITYSFRFGNKFKIYAPYEQDKKWFSNTSKKHIQGFDQLPENGSILYITSSLKDIMCLYAMGLPAVAFQSEMQMPGEMQLQMLRKRFKRIILFYDNDFESKDNPGQTMAAKISQTYQLANVSIPSNWKTKDISDAIVVHGFKTVKNFIHENSREQTQS